MRELESALQDVLAALPAPRPEVIPTAASFGRYAFAPIQAALDLPPFDNSAMDGYAVRSEDLRTAARPAPVHLSLLGQLAAGETGHGPLEPGTCIRVFTGSMLPNGADAVVMQEDVRLDEEPARTRVAFQEPVSPWENIRFRGEDLRTGDCILQAGTRIRIGHLGLLAATGVPSVTVGARPVVGLLATGNELCEPGCSLEPGRLFESNRITLAQLLRSAGAEVNIRPLVRDDLRETQRALDSAFADCDCVVTSGGASVGQFDLVKDAFTALGGRVMLWKIAMKPGKPFVFGALDGKFLFGVPGNPVSAIVTCLLLVRPALLRWQGAREVEPPTARGILASDFSNPGERRHFFRVRQDDSGQVTPAGKQGSHILSSLAAADGLLDVPARSTLKAGMAVKVVRWE